MPTANVYASGTVFRNAALTGDMTITNGLITNYGYTSDLTVSLAADLATGKSVMRIEGNGNWIEGTLGLTGSGCDFILPSNPTATNGFSLGNITITANAVPVGGIEGLVIQFGATGAMQTLTVAEQVYTGMAVGNGSATQSRWRCAPITAPAYRLDAGVETLTGNNITYHVFPGLDSDGRIDVWLFAEAAHDAAGTWSGGAPQVASNREYGKIGLSVSVNGTAQTMWDGTTQYQCEFQRATSMRWQSQGMPWATTSTAVAALQASGKVMKHKSQNIHLNMAPVAPYADLLTYQPFKVLGNIDQNNYAGDAIRGGATGGERYAVGFVHEAMARFVAELGTHGNDAYATAGRIATLKNIAESTAQIAIAGGVISPTDYRLVDPGGDPNGPFVYARSNGSSFVGKLLPMPSSVSPEANHRHNGAYDHAHAPNVVSYYAYQLSKDPFHMFLTQATAAAMIGATTNTGAHRGADGRTNLIAGEEERGYWWGLKTLVEAWAVTPAGTMPAPFRSRAFFEDAITNTLTKIRTYIGNTSTVNNRIMDLFGSLYVYECTSQTPAATYKAIHPLSLDYGNYVMCHIRRMGYTAMDDVIIWHGRNMKVRCAGGGNYFSAEFQPNVNGVSMVVGIPNEATIPYTNGTEYAAWHPIPTKHSGDYPFSEWFSARSADDAGNYAFQFIGSLACYKHLAEIGVAFDWTPSTEYTALLARIKGPVNGETSMPTAWVKHYYDFS